MLHVTLVKTISFHGFERGTKTYRESRIIIVLIAIKKGGKKNLEKRELPRCFSHRSRAKFVDIVTLTALPLRRYIGYQSTIRTADAKFSRSEILSSRTRGKQNNFCAEGRRQSFARVSNFRLFAGFVVLSGDRYFRK